MSRQKRDLSKHGLWFMEHAQLPQYCSPVVIDFFSGQRFLWERRQLRVIFHSPRFNLVLMALELSDTKHPGKRKP